MIIEMIENTTYYISPEDLQTILSGTLTRLRVLLSPLCGSLPFGVSPSEADVAAAADTLRLCNQLIVGLRSRSTLHDMKKKQWLDDAYWRAFQLKCSDAAIKVERQCDNGFLAAYKTLDATVKEIIILVSRKNKWDGLFGSFSMQQLYGEIASELYERFINGKNLNHIQQMKSLATMYEVLREQCDGGKIFQGPDFDDLLFKVCGIRYNSSEKPRGRYRQVGDWWAKLYDAEGDNKKSREYLDMRAFVRERLCGGRTSRKEAVVPEFMRERQAK